MKKRLLQIFCILTLLFAITASCLVPVFGASDRTTVKLVDTTTVWSYLDNNTDPAEGYSSPTAWTLADYDDSAWKTASGTFGSKNGALAAVNGYTPTVLLPLNNGGNNYMAYFFRTTVNLSGIDKLDAISFSAAADDALVVYVNGKIVIDTRNTKNNTTSLHYSATSVNTYTTWFNNAELSEYFVEGENVISASVHNSNATSSDVYFGLNVNAEKRSGGFVTSFENVVLNVGADETQRNVTWYSNSDAEAEVQWAPAEGVAKGSFPETYSSAKASVSKAQNAPGDYTNKATITGLTENTEYVYRLKKGTRYSELRYFTAGPFENFDFIVFGDPQIRSWTFTSSPNDLDYWIDTLGKVDADFDPEFYITLGDQVNTKNYENEYDSLIQPQLGENAYATNIGNHDNGSSAYADHFNLPNQSVKYGVSTTGADYWYTYGNVLVMSLNTWTGSIADHANFIKETVAANPDTDWQIVTMHVAPFSAGNHANGSEVVSVRDSLTPYMNEYGIDVVLGGHDHIYTRTHLMDGNTVHEDQSTVDAVGVLYICAGASAGKFYDETTVKGGEGYEYVDYTYYEQNAVFLHFDVTETSLSLKTYRVKDMAVIDTFTLAKSEAAPLKEAIDRAVTALSKAEGTLPENYLTALRAAITEGNAVYNSFDTASAEDIVSAIELLNTKSSEALYELENYNKLSAGAKQTGADTAANLTVRHLEAGATYVFSGGGAGKNVTLTKQNADGTTTEVITWKEGGTSVRLSSSNPHVAFILDGDVTLTGAAKWEFSNVIFDLNGHSLILNNGSSIPFTTTNAGSIEFRGEGTIDFRATSKESHPFTMNHYYSALVFNGDITFVDSTKNLKYFASIKGLCNIYGTLTIDETFDTTSGYAFYVQGSRSNGSERTGSINIIDATLNYNCAGGSPLFYAKGISGTSPADGKIYTSIPQVNITGSRVNLKSQMITTKWGSDSVSGKDGSGNSLTSCINKTELNITNSYIYADYPVSSGSDARVTMINPAGYTTINVTDSTIYTERGVIFRSASTNSAKLYINAERSTFYAGTTEAESTAQSTDSSVRLRGIVVASTDTHVGKLVFRDCTLSSKYRIFDGSAPAPDTIKFFSECYNCNLIVNTKSSGGGSAVCRSSVVISGGSIDCGTGTIAYRVLPYCPEYGTGLLIKGSVTINNIGTSSLATAGNAYVLTVSEYAALAATDSTVYSTSLSSNYFTIEDRTELVSITLSDTLASKYAYKLIRSVTKGVEVKGNIVLDTDFTYKLYIPAKAEISAITVDGTAYALDALELIELEGVSHYVIEVKVGVTSSLDSFIAEIKLTDTDSTVISGKWTLSVADHLVSLLATEQNETTYTLAKDILSYIRSAYVYAGIDGGKLAMIDSIIGEDYDKSSTPNTDCEALTDTAGLSSAQLMLGDAPAFVFCTDGNYSYELYSFTVGGAPVEAEAVAKDGKVYLYVKLHAYRMTDTVRYEIEGTDIAGEYNLKAYYEFAKGENDDALVSLVERLWRYAESAKAYKAMANA